MVNPKQPYRHYSFDLWCTLIKSNPQFKEKRVDLFYEQFNARGISRDEMAGHFRQVDLMCNKINELDGSQISAEQMYWMVLLKAHADGFDHTFNMDEIMQSVDQLFFRYPPVFCHEKVPEILKKIKNKPDTTMSILSNTAFIKGKTLRTLMKDLGIDDLFDFQVYSDEVGFSKPSIKIFSYMLDEVIQLKTDIKKHEVVHIGDNAVADVRGALAFGIEARQIGANEIKIEDLIRYEL